MNNELNMNRYAFISKSTIGYVELLYSNSEETSGVIKIHNRFTDALLDKFIINDNGLLLSEIYRKFKELIKMDVDIEYNIIECSNGDKIPNFQ